MTKTEKTATKNSSKTSSKSAPKANIGKASAAEQKRADKKLAERKPAKKAKVIKAEPFCSQESLDAINEVLASTKGAMKMPLFKRIIESYHEHCAEQVAKTGTYVLRGLCKLYAHCKPALPRRRGKLPGQTEETWLPARKESYVGKARALRALKDAGLQYGKLLKKAK